jgi:hypothetical protein
MGTDGTSNAHPDRAIVRQADEHPDVHDPRVVEVLEQMAPVGYVLRAGANIGIYRQLVSGVFDGWAHGDGRG